MVFANEFTWRVLLMRFAPIFFWLGVIFLLSSSVGASAESSRFVGPIVKFFFPNIDTPTLAIVHGLVRKTAHVTEYAILAALATRAVFSLKSGWARRYWPLFPILLVVITAAADEYNQSFNALRTGSPWDVVLDISGGLMAIASIWLYRKRKQQDQALEPGS